MTVVASGRQRPAAGARDLRALPKGHLHLHLEAGMRPATLTDMCRRLGIEPPPTSGFTGFTEFVRCYRALLAVLQAPEHLERLFHEVFEDQAADGVVYVELAVSPALYAEAYGSTPAALARMVAFADAASRAHGVSHGLMATVDRTAGAAQAVEVARAAAALAGEGVVALGLANDERGFPCRDFAEAFAIARAAGLQATPHAGELAGPESVREAIDVLHADRVLHGVRAIEDPALVAVLAERGIPLDVCPTSNVLLDVVDAIEDHPLPRLLAAGVRCSINADDPLLFGPGILAEYETCRTALGLSDVQLAACAWTSIETTSAPVEVKAAARERMDAWMDEKGTQA
ncbi:adenosine deaminase [Microbacterium betulae]|uniref:Adenosine deaminase n=1 Tax=Microbacterium betulae TaxID=2981139 RepID=A0AA97FIN4_9MICO|nr:adenosine deaminase [Microbacterium sp. AB]WOF23329.1 adenosine deaminase [Microbacterium sp. AB]